MNTLHSWYLCYVRYDKQTEKGEKTISEAYLVDALTITEAEQRIIEEVTPLVTGEFDVPRINRQNYSDVIEDHSESADKWYEAKIAFVILDEKTQAEKEMCSRMMIQAASFHKALENLDKHMSGSMCDWIVKHIKETKVMDIFKFKSNE